MTNEDIERLVLRHAADFDHPVLGVKVTCSSPRSWRPIWSTPLLACAVILVGCVGGVTLRHPDTGVTAECGKRPLMYGVGYMEHERCLDDYQRQGYQRVPR